MSLMEFPPLAGTCHMTSDGPEAERREPDAGLIGRAGKRNMFLWGIPRQPGQGMRWRVEVYWLGILKASVLCLFVAIVRSTHLSAVLRSAACARWLPHSVSARSR